LCGYAGAERRRAGQRRQRRDSYASSFRSREPAVRVRVGEEASVRLVADVHFSTSFASPASRLNVVVVRPRFLILFEGGCKMYSARSSCSLVMSTLCTVASYLWPVWVRVRLDTGSELNSL
jgi:hypothetical protein